MSRTSRRDFLRQLGGGAIGAMLPGCAGRGASGGGREQDRIERVSSPLASRSAPLSVGCAAITWGGDDARAIEDISALGFPGIQLRANVLTHFAGRPSALRELLGRHRLRFVALSSGNVQVDAPMDRVIDEHVSHAQFLREAGGLYLQLIDERPKGRAVEPADYGRLGRLLTEIGKRTSDIGIAVGYHHHVGSIGEKPAEIDRVLDASDPKYVRLLLDVAHYQVGGGDPVGAIRRYADRLLFLHIKDVVMSSAPGVTPSSFQFVELGRGSVDLRGVFAALRDVRFRGWAVVELDSVTDRGRTPRESAASNKRYLEDVIGVRVY
jgi:inosose dehydratase